MNKLKFLGLIIFIIFPVGLFAQVLPNPAPGIEAEIKKASEIKLRSVEIERMKRDAAKYNSNKSNVRTKAKFAEIKEDFEDIQKLQSSIVKIYTTGKTINYSKISKSSREMNKNALRLNENLFETESDKDLEKIKIINTEPINVRNLIIDLDNAIGKFVENPMFKNSKIVKSETSKNAQVELRKIISISDKLSVLAATKE